MEQLLHQIAGLLASLAVLLGVHGATAERAPTPPAMPEQAIVESVSQPAQARPQYEKGEREGQSMRQWKEREDDGDDDSEEVDDHRVSQPKTTVAAPAPKPVATPSASATTAASGITMIEIAKHNSAASCYAAINGSVYDLTSWVSRHPGGPSAVLRLCGTDGSAAFNNQHGGQSRPESILATFRIAALQK